MHQLGFWPIVLWGCGAHLANPWCPSAKGATALTAKVWEQLGSGRPTGSWGGVNISEGRSPGSPGMRMLAQPPSHFPSGQPCAMARITTADKGLPFAGQRGRRCSQFRFS